MAVDKVIIEYQLKTDQLRKELDEVKGEIGAVQDTATKSATNMSGTFAKLGGAIAAAFSIQQIVQFTAASIKLAAEAEGVKKAFDRLNDATLLNKLRQATNNMVSDLELMKSAVKASNFKLPLDQLATYFEFATKRAKETGESVDYLVESIVLGISRKSIPILDNLGISAAEVQSEFEKTGDMATAVGAIIERSMAGAAASTHDYGDSIAQTRANIENLQVSIGEKLLVPLEKVLGTVNRSIDIFTAAGKILGNFDVAFKSFKWGGQAFDLRAHKATSLIDEANEVALKTVDSIENLSAELAALQEILVKQEIGSAAFIATQKEIDRIQRRLTDATKKSTVAKKEDTKAVWDNQKAYEEAQAEIGKWVAFMLDYNTGSREVIEQNQRIEESIHGVSDALGEQRERMQSVIDAEQELAEKQSQNQEAALEITQAVGEFRAALWQKETDDYIAQLDAQLAAGKISQETFDRLSSEALAENAKKQKEAAMFDIIIKTAQAVIALLAQGNVAGSLAAGITGALQLAVVSGAPIPAFAEGVVDLKGKGTETSDDILARLSRGESVITARGTRQDKGLFEAANKMQLEEYINKNYVLPVLLKKQSEQQSAFDDYRLWLATMSNGKKMEKGNKEIVKAIKQTGFNQRRYWA